MKPAENDNLEWIALTPERVEGDQARVYREILDAFDSFRIEYEKGQETSTWLKEHALDGWPHLVTWVCWDRDTEQIDGFFSVHKIKPNPGDFGDVSFDVRRKPASEIKNLRRNFRARLSEDELVEWAVYFAVDLWREVGASEVAVVLDPAGAKLHRNHDFWLECADKKRLWNPFQA
jgi:hypothetical protein